MIVVLKLAITKCSIKLLYCSLQGRNQNSPRRVVIVIVAIVVVESKHARIRTIVVVTASFEPRVSGIREVRILQFNTYIT